MRRPLFAIALPLGLAGGALAFLIAGPDFRATALRLGGAAGGAASTGYKLTAAAGEPAAGSAASTGYRLEGGFIPAMAPPRVQVAADQGGTFPFYCPWGSVILQIPAGAFSQDVVPQVQPASAFPPPLSDVAALKGTSVVVDITNDKDLQPLKPISLTLPYRDADVQGMDESKLRVAFCRTDGKWTPLPTVVDPAANTVTALIAHFSLYQVMGLAPSAGLSQLTAYPNPLRPAKGHAAMTLSNMPADALVEIRTRSGDLVRNLTSNAVGQASWDGRTGDGSQATSGVYLVFVRKGSAQKLLKVAVER